MAQGIEQMNVIYKKNIQGHNLIIPCKKKENNYCLNMLLNNKIKGILHLEILIIDNIQFYSYEITGHEDLSSLLEKKQVQYSQIKTILLNIIKAIMNGREYLLYEQDYILDAQYIYLNTETLEVLLCYYVGYEQDIMEQLNSVIELLMNKVDYKDEKAVLLIYGLYKISKEDGVTFSKLIEYLEKRNDGLMGVNENKAVKNIINTSMDAKYINPVPDKAPPIKHKKEEKIYSDEEILEYPIKIKIGLILTTILGVGIILACLRSGVLMNSIGNKLDITKMFGLILLIGTTEAYVYGKLLNKENKIARIKEKVSYVNKHTRENMVTLEKKTQLLSSKRSDKTTLLGEQSRWDSWKGYELVPVDILQYKTIKIKDLPFFIGNTGEKKNGMIESDVISRYHAKIEYKEGEFYLSDLNSTNGTYLNYNRIDSNDTNVLSLQDEVMFANICYIFQRSS